MQNSGDTIVCQDTPNSRKAETTGRILIADDEDVIRYIIATALKLEGWEIIEAKDGEEALHRIMAESPDLVLLDHRMPLMLGSEVYAAILEKGIKCPVILMTAASNIKEIAEWFMFEHYLAKPFTLIELRETITKVVDSCVSHQVSTN